MCHILLMMPVLGLSVFWFWPMDIALPVYFAVLFLSGMLYFLVFRAFREPVHSGAEAMLRQRGEVVETLDPDGLIRLRGELWRATSSEHVRCGEKVEVVGINRLTLEVRRSRTAVTEKKDKRCPL